MATIRPGDREPIKPIKWKEERRAAKKEIEVLLKVKDNNLVGQVIHTPARVRKPTSKILDIKDIHICPKCNSKHIEIRGVVQEALRFKCLTCRHEHMFC